MSGLEMSCGEKGCKSETFKIEITPASYIVIICTECDAIVSKNMTKWTKGLKK